MFPDILKNPHSHPQLYQCTPQVLLPVLPHLHAELEALDEPQRLAATELLVSLLCMPGSDIAEHFPKLTEVRGAGQNRSSVHHATPHTSCLDAPVCVCVWCAALCRYS